MATHSSTLAWRIPLIEETGGLQSMWSQSWTQLSDSHTHTDTHTHTHVVVWASLVAQTIKNLPAMQETWVQPLGQEDLLEKAMATHSSILAWRIPWTDPGRLHSMASQTVECD